MILLSFNGRKFWKSLEKGILVEVLLYYQYVNYFSPYGVNLYKNIFKIYFIFSIMIIFIIKENLKYDTKQDYSEQEGIGEYHW